ncbi:GPP34 family phosphoprotein [Amycolatopsis sp. NPDC004368]
MTLSLAARAYLLACDPDRGRVRRRSDAALLVRAAAVADLVLRGRLAVAGGRVSAAGHGPVGDLLLDDLLADLTEEGPMRWKRLVQRESADTVRSLELQLAAAGLVRVPRRKVVELVDRTPADEIRATVDAALSGSTVDDATAALTALAAAAEVGFTRCSARRHARRLEQLALAAGVTELRAAVRHLRARRFALLASG